MDRSLTAPWRTVSPGLVRVTIDVAPGGVPQGSPWPDGFAAPTSADIRPAAAWTAAEPAASVTGDAAIRRLAATLSGEASAAADLRGGAEHVAGVLARLYRDGDAAGEIPAATLDVVGALLDTPATASAPSVPREGTGRETDLLGAIRATFGTILGRATPRDAAAAGRDGGVSGFDA